MISCLLMYFSRNQKGLQSCNEIRIAGEPIELGRGAACQIHLPDHRVNLLHARIQRSAEGTLEIVAIDDALISINGFMERTAPLNLGSLVSIGPYLLTVEPTVEDVDLTLSVSMRKSSARIQEGIPPTPLTLSGLGIRKRWLGLGLAALILLGMLLLPLMTRVSPDFETWQAKLPIALTSMLNPGPLSSGHRGFGMQCSTCHQSAFRAVTDQACTDCHKRAGMHLAEHADLLDKTRCTDCHPVHAGKASAMNSGLTALCVTCHRDAGKTVAGIRDFDVTHPPFHLTLPDNRALIRFRQDGKEIPAEKSGLKFSHRIHLVKKGLSTPQGDTILTCRDCHKLEDSGNHFAPMDMKMTCQQSRCHTLRFAEPLVGVIPHGAERPLMDRLRSYYANRLAETPEELSDKCGRAGTIGNLAERTLACAERLARNYAATTLFIDIGSALQCGECHEITATESKETPWRIDPLHPNRDWQPKAIFPHARHDTVECTECHDKRASKSSQDIAMPSIEKCRTCHTGTHAVTGKVTSNCEDCHRFHRHAGPGSTVNSAHAS